MTSMSHDPAAAVIAAQTIEIGTRALAAGAAAASSVTALTPAGAEEVSAQAAAAFAAEAASAMAAHAAAQEELMRAGAALIEVARMYAQADSEAAGTLISSAGQLSSQVFAGPSAGAGLAQAEVLPGALGSAARTPLMANLIEGVAAANPSTTLPGAANAAATVLGAGSAPLSSISQLASMGGAAGSGAAPGLATSLTGEEESNPEGSGDQETNDQQTGEQLL
jgi:PE family